jgi:hypothetical protein
MTVLAPYAMWRAGKMKGDLRLGIMSQRERLAPRAGTDVLDALGSRPKRPLARRFGAP